MGFKDKFLQKIISLANFHPKSLEYLGASDRINLKAEISIPKELIPGASLLVAQAWANTGIFENAQHLPKPYWAEKQMDPESVYFEAIGHRLLSMNVTLRNWSMVSIPGYETEAIIDPIGALTPKHEDYSIEIWALKEVEEGKIKIFRPHVNGTFYQVRDEDNYPAIKNIWSFEGGKITWEIYAEGDSLGQWACLDVYPELNDENYKIIIAVRPYNYDGIVFIEKIKVVGRTVTITPRSKILLTTDYDYYFLGEYPFNDPADPYEIPEKLKEDYEYVSPAKLATALFVFSEGAIGARVFMEGRIEAEPPTNSWDDYWKNVLPTLPEIKIGETEYQKAFKATAVDLLMVWDGNSITPGPANYHHFWIRDNAYILPALLQLGKFQEVEAILQTYPKRQQKNGYFVSQKGEWDANGQAIYAISQYIKYSKDEEFLSKIINNVWKAAQWIENKRHQWDPPSEEYQGLLPPGFSAEHFGGTDSYYWDQFWSIKGMQEAIYLLEKAEQTEKAEIVKQWLNDYFNDVLNSISIVTHKLNSKAIPTSPRRKYDSAMIGSIAALYPLRIFDEFDEKITASLEKIKEVSWSDDLFFQRNGHMALGTYLSLHVAHSHLWRGESSEALKIWNKLLEYATPTFTWPEGINARTKTGGMGDGNHIWAAADVNMFLRDLVIFEKNNTWYLLHGIDLNTHKKVRAKYLPLENSIIRELSASPKKIEIEATRFPNKLVIKTTDGVIEKIPDENSKTFILNL